MLASIQRYKVLKKAKQKHIENKKQALELASKNAKLANAFEISAFNRHMANKIEDCERQMDILAKDSIIIKVMRAVGF